MSPPPPPPPPHHLPHLTPLTRQVLAAIIVHHPFTHPPPPSFPGLSPSSLLPILLSLPSLLFLPPPSLGRQHSSSPPRNHNRRFPSRSRSLASLSLLFYSFAHSLAGLSPPHPLTFRAMARLLALSPLPFPSLLHFLKQNPHPLLSNPTPTLTSLLPLLPPLPALRLFRLIPRPDAQSYNTTISTLCRSCHFAPALSLLSQMHRRRCPPPDTFTYTILISAFCRHARRTACPEAVRHRIWQANHLFRRMLAEGLQPDVVTYNCLIDGLCKTYRVGRAREVFEEMGRRGCTPNRVTYNSFVRYYGKVNEVDKGIEMMREMVERGHGVVTCSTYTPIVHSLCEVGRVREAREFLVEMVEGGSTPREFTYRLVCEALRREGEEGLPLDLRRKIESGIDERYRRVMQVKPMMKRRDHGFVQQQEEDM